MSSVPDSGREPATVRLILFGEFRAERDGRPLDDRAWQRRGGKQLVKLLATSPDHRLHREQIQDTLWPDLSPESAAGSLRKALHHARHALEPDLGPRAASSYIHLRDDAISLASSTVWIDADAFQAAADAALRDGDPELLEQALASYRGDLLPEDQYEEWCLPRRTALMQTRLRLLLRLADLHEQTGRFDAAIDRFREVLAYEPGREDVHRRIMRLLARTGRRHDALRQYQACRTALRDEFDAPPEPETEALYQDLLAARPLPLAGPEPSRRLPAAVRRQSHAMMVGRDPAFATMMDALRRAAHGHGAALLVGGEAGVGKSRLVAETARRAFERGMLVLWGSTAEAEGQLPHEPIIEALDGAIAGLTAERREYLMARFPELADLLPALGGAGTARDDAESSRHPSGTGGPARLLSSMAAMLDKLALRQPLMLVLDDLHAADVAVMQIFGHLARLAADRRWLLVGTFRTGDLAARAELRHLLSTSVRAGVASRVDLERLPRGETDHLIANLLPGGAVPPELLDDIFNHSLGNPLFINEIIQSMRDAGGLSLVDGSWVADPDVKASVPGQVIDLIDTRVDRLGADVRSSLTLLAVAGADASFRILRDASTLDEARLLDALDRALGAHLIEERGDGYGFQHPLIRATLYEQLSRTRRARLHGKLATMIERQANREMPGLPLPVEALAHHWTEAGEPGRAIPYLLSAADRAARVYANADAIQHLRHALRLLDESAPVAGAPGIDRTAILEQLGDLHALTGEAEPAQAAYAAAIRAGVTDALQSARLRRKCGQQALFAGSIAAANLVLDEARADLDRVADDQQSTTELARIMAVRAQGGFLAFRFPEALASGEESLRLARAAGSPIDEARACEMIAMACLPLGQWRRGLELEQRIGSLLERSAVACDSADVHLCLAEYHLYGETPRDAAHNFLQTLSEAERAGASRTLALCNYFLGTMAYCEGKFNEGLIRLEEAISLYRHVGSASGEAIAIMMRGLTLTALGRLDEARNIMDQALALAESSTLRSHAQIRLYAGLGRNRLDANDPAGARRYAERALALVEVPSDCICYAAIYPVATAAFALTGELPRATELGVRALAQARAINSPFLLCVAQQSNALVHAGTGNWDAAFEALDDARHLSEQHKMPYEAGRTLLMRSFVHMQRHSPRDVATASRLNSQAWPILLRLGVRASAAQARSSLGFMRGHLWRRPESAITTDAG